MTRADWHRLLGYWCEILGILEAPRLLLVPASEIPGCDAVAEFDDCRAQHWTVRIRRGKHADPDLLMAHELLHVRTGLTDATHEAWICDVSRALVGLKGARA
jgi:hypothetical protein